MNRVRKLLARVTRAFRWRLTERVPLTKWIHRAGRIVLLGDACHPMLPYRAQGAAMAIEDAAVLGGILSRLAGQGTGTDATGLAMSALTASHLTLLLEAYERLRFPRTAATQATSALNRYTFHLPDGPEQRARDASMRKAMLRDEQAAAAEAEADLLSDSGHGPPSGSSTGVSSPTVPSNNNLANANQWADRRKNREQYGYDADAVVEVWWDAEGRAQLEGLVTAQRADSATLASSSTGSRSIGGKKKGSFWRRLAGKRCDDEE